MLLNTSTILSVADVNAKGADEKVSAFIYLSFSYQFFNLSPFSLNRLHSIELF